MAQDAAEGWLSGDISGEPDAPRVGTGGHLHGGALGLGHYGRQGKEPVEHSACVAVHVANRSPHLCIVKRGDILLEKVDQPGFTLKDRKKRERFTAASFSACRR